MELVSHNGHRLWGFMTKAEKSAIHSTTEFTDVPAVLTVRVVSVCRTALTKKFVFFFLPVVRYYEC